MSKLTFRRSTGTVILTSSNNKIIGIWKAHNEVVAKDTTGISHVPFPVGTWAYDTYHAHAQENLYPATFHDRFGGLGILLFKGPGLGTGMGVHSGRTTGAPFAIGTKTYGCIRVTREAMKAINAQHRSGDRVMNITVEF